MPPRPSPKAHPIGLRIKQIRAFLGRPRRAWSQPELARALKMDPRTLRRREADGRLSGEDATALATLARCDVSWILMGKGEGPGTKREARAPQRLADDGETGTGVSHSRAPSSDAPRQQRSDAGLLLRALTAQNDHLRRRVEKSGTDDAAFNALIAQTAGQMLADRIAVLFKETFENNEIANTAAGRAFTIAFLERVVEEFGARGLNVTDMARYVIELRRERGKP